MTEPTNKDRAERGKIILDLFTTEPGRVGDHKFNMVLLLGALRHVCDLENMDFGKLDKMAYKFYLDDLAWEKELNQTNQN